MTGGQYLVLVLLALVVIVVTLLSAMQEERDRCRRLSDRELRRELRRYDDE